MFVVIVYITRPYPQKILDGKYNYRNIPEIAEEDLVLLVNACYGLQDQATLSTIRIRRKEVTVLAVLSLGSSVSKIS
jgi:hypothetical protein